MKILFLTQVLPYPIDAGPKVRAYYVLRYLAQNHEISLVSFVRPDDRPQSYAHLRQYVQELITIPMPRSRWRDGVAFMNSLLRKQPFLITRDQAAEMHKTLRKLVSNNAYAAIHADQLWMAAYALNVAEGAGRKFNHPQSVPSLSTSQPGLVLDQHNAVYLIPQRMAAEAQNPLLRRILSREAHQMARYEERTCSCFDRVVWVSEQDLAAVRGVSSYPSDSRASASVENTPKRSIHSNLVIPICIDPHRISPEALSARLAPSAEATNLLFLGGMHWPPNADGVSWFIRDILPRLQAQLPQIKFHVVGKSPPPEAFSTAGVIAPGYVSDLDVIWKEADLFIVPLRAGGGMRVKILDAWARGLPVISTTIGAEGLVYRDGENILIADTPQAFLEKIMLLNRDLDLRASLALNGRRTVETHYDWKTVYAAFDQLYASLQERSAGLERP